MDMTTLAPWVTIEADYDDVQAITWQMISHTYRGKDGCACGCRGVYSYPSAAATLERTGYVDLQAVSIKRMANAMRDLQAAPAGAVMVTRLPDGTLMYELPMGNDRCVRVYIRNDLRPYQG